MRNSGDKIRNDILTRLARLGLSSRWGWLALGSAAVALLTAGSFLLFSFPLETITLSLFILGVLLLERG
jgi:hypothetical protein